MTPTQPMGMLHRHIAAGLTSRNETLACVEIGSGGQVSSFLTSEPGSSAFFAGALILTADASVWPQSIMGRCGWRHDPLESLDRLCELAAIAQVSLARIGDLRWFAGLQQPVTPCISRCVPQVAMQPLRPRYFRTKCCNPAGNNWYNPSYSTWQSA